MSQGSGPRESHGRDVTGLRRACSSPPTRCCGPARSRMPSGSASSCLGTWEATSTRACSYCSPPRHPTEGH
eukprot:9443936-Pyramimonas_sp.AAC.1